MDISLCVFVMMIILSFVGIVAIAFGVLLVKHLLQEDPTRKHNERR